jgi:C-terminal processing protease CtpA/Prc
MKAIILVMTLFISLGLGPTCRAQGIVGIGVALGKHGPDYIVHDVLPDSPAAGSKAIHSGDRILAIAEGESDPVKLSGLEMLEAVNLIRGPKGSAVRVIVVPAGKPDSEAQVVSLVRGQLKLNVAPREDVLWSRLSLPMWLFQLGLSLSHP